MTGKDIIWVKECSTVTKPSLPQKMKPLLWPHSVMRRLWANSCCWCLVDASTPAAGHHRTPTKGQEREPAGKRCLQQNFLKDSSIGWTHMDKNGLRYYVLVSCLQNCKKTVNLQPACLEYVCISGVWMRDPVLEELTTGKGNQPAEKQRPLQKALILNMHHSRL